MDTATLLISFFTGLTTGGLSCFAVQGGLLTSSIAATQEQVIVPPVSANKHSKAGPLAARSQPGAQKRILQPILLFLSSKLVIHILFGFMLGWAGSVLSPSPVARGLLQLGVGLFMVGNALRLLEVHPIFRAFTFEPPRAFSRMIRKKAKQGSDWTTPVLLGSLTVLIPCGITQIMMASAISAGSPWMGAAILGAFVLGASPTFFGVTYLAARLSALFEKQFMRVLAVMILLLGLYSIDTGLTLAGSPYSMTRAINGFRGKAAPAVVVITPRSPAARQAGPLQPLGPLLADGLATPAGAAQNVRLGDQTDLQIDVYNNGYAPETVYAPAGKDLHVKLITKGVYSCSRAFVIPGLNFQKLLPATGEVSINIPAQKAGTIMPFMCSMGMYTGQIVFE